MRKRFTNLIIASLMALLGATGLAVLGSQATFAACSEANKNTPACAAQRGVDSTGTQNKSCGQNGNEACTLGDTVKTVINVLLFVVGSLSVIMLIIGGIRYVLSNGDSSQITSAKNTVLYAVIGLVVALLAYAIVNFVVVQFT